MGKKNRRKAAQPLEQLIEAADPAVLSQLIQQLAASGSSVRRQCLEFLQKHVTVTSERNTRADVEAVFSIWDELEPDLADLNEYGGGPDEIVDHVAGLRYDLAQKLKQCAIPRDDRCELLDYVMPFISRGNSGLEDPLHEVAYALCQDDEDWRQFAIRLEKSRRDALLNHSRRIYRNLGDRDKYLALRSRCMEYGADYFDLASFYWEQGDRDKAIEIAREGLQKAKGRMDELQAFVTKRGEKGVSDGLKLDQVTDSKLCNFVFIFCKWCD